MYINVTHAEQWKSWNGVLVPLIVVISNARPEGPALPHNLSYYETVTLHEMLHRCIILTLHFDWLVHSCYMWDMTKCLIRTTQHVLSSAYIRTSNCLWSVKSKTPTIPGASLAVTYVPIYMYYAVRFCRCAFRVAVTLLDVQYIKPAWVTSV